MRLQAFLSKNVIAGSPVAASFPISLLAFLCNRGSSTQSRLKATYHNNSASEAHGEEDRQMSSVVLEPKELAHRCEVGVDSLQPIRGRQMSHIVKDHSRPGGL